MLRIRYPPGASTYNPGAALSLPAALRLLSSVVRGLGQSTQLGGSRIRASTWGWASEASDCPISPAPTHCRPGAPSHWQAKAGPVLKGVHRASASAGWSLVRTESVTISVTLLWCQAHGSLKLRSSVPLGQPATRTVRPGAAQPTWAGSGVGGLGVPAWLTGTPHNHIPELIVPFTDEEMRLQRRCDSEPGPGGAGGKAS